MVFEVEQKFRVNELTGVREQLVQLGATFEQAKRQVDRYFAHPNRNFAETDEAFRLRRDGTANRITYKGPKVDTTTKTRREIELPLPEGSDYLNEFTELLAALGFRSVAEVSKQRTIANISWQSQPVEVSLDQVDAVGTFVELELLTDEDGVAAARKRIATLAEELGLSNVVRSSYLELLLQVENG